MWGGTPARLSTVQARLLLALQQPPAPAFALRPGSSVLGVKTQNVAPASAPGYPVPVRMRRRGGHALSADVHSHSMLSLR